MSGCEHGSTNSTNRAFLLAIIANGIFVVLQIVCARMASSTSLFADAIHNLGDVLSLIVAWLGNYLLFKKPTAKSTYGLKKASILAALFNVLLLVFTCGIIFTEALAKFFNPGPIDSTFVIIVAWVGVLINAATAVLFIKDGGDVNIRAAYLHLASDAAVSLGVVIAAFAYWWTKWLWIDPVVGILIAILILKSGWSLLLDSTRLILDGVPRNICYFAVKELLQKQSGVADVHELHIWALSTKENALSAHLYMPKNPLSDFERFQISQKLLTEHNIQHVTIQVESNQDYCINAFRC